MGSKMGAADPNYPKIQGLSRLSRLSYGIAARKSEVWMGSWLVATTLMPIKIGYNLLLVRILGESRRLGTHRFC